MRKLERDEEGGAPGRVYIDIKRRALAYVASYKTCRAPPSLASYSPLWQPPVHVDRKGAKASPRALPSLPPLPGEMK
jgi:hypothetical protein